MAQMESSMDVQRVAALEAQYEHVATKADVGDVRTEIANLRTEIANVRAELRADIESLRSEFKTMKWWIGIAIPLTALAVQLFDRAIM